DLERYPAIAAVAREDLAERLERAAIGRLLQVDRHLARDALAHRVERRHLARQDPHGLVVALERPAHEHQRPGLDQTRRLLIRLWKDDDLDGADGVFEREHRHPIALARLQL